MMTLGTRCNSESGRLVDLAWSKSSGVSVTVLDGTLSRSITPASAGGCGSSAGAATGEGPGAPPVRGAARVLGVLSLLGRVLRTVDSGDVPMTRTSGRLIVASSANATAGTATTAGTSSAARAVARNATAARYRPDPPPRIALTGADPRQILKYFRARVPLRFANSGRELLAMWPRGHSQGNAPNAWQSFAMSRPRRAARRYGSGPAGSWR